MRRAWLTLLVAFLIGGAVIAFAGDTRTSNSPTASLPSSTESARVAALQRELPSGGTNPALVVFARGGDQLTEDDLAAIEKVGTPILSPGRDAAIVTVPLPSGVPTDERIGAVEQLRAKAKDGLPAGLTAQVTGGAGFAADLADSFSGADTRLLIATVIVVALLLLVTYRSPILWLVPLAVVGFADRIATAVLALFSRHTDLAINESTAGIVTVLVFGAGTNYALLLISRYREELHREQDRLLAMRAALRGAGPAIAASGGTVILSLLTLLLADLGNIVSIGVTAAAGIGVALLFALLVLPAAMVVCGRGLFWPFVPKVGARGVEAERGIWARIGRLVAKRPVIVIVASVIVLGLLGTGIAGTRLGLTETEKFRVKAEAVDGAETVGRYFPPGLSEPAVVLAPVDRADEVLALASATPGVAQARPGERTAEWASIIVTPSEAGSFDTVRELRDRVGAADALVGGSVALESDTRELARRDLTVVVPVILIVVLGVLILLLRALVAPILLILTVIASFAAALGAGSLIFGGALDTQVPLLAFLFLVALGVDYNIFLVTRAKEETPARGTVDGMVHALAVTGGVITSAGILLAAVFAVLGVLPVVTLTQMGVIVGIGVLLDTLLVRTVLVPALATLCGDRFWWPGRLSAAGDRHAGEGH